MKRMSVAVIGPHDNSGASMKRYGRLLLSDWRDLGYLVEDVRPHSICARWASTRSLGKLGTYIDKFMLFLPRLIVMGRRSTLVHIADHSDALWALVLPRNRLIVTCHDLLAVRASRDEIPEHRTRWSGRLYQRLVVTGLKRAAHIIAVSEVTAGDVIRITGHKPTVIHHYVDQKLLDSSRTPLSSDRAPYALVVSRVGWRKRREAALRTWLRLREQPAYRTCGLRIVGDPLTETERQLLGDQLSDVRIQHGLTDIELGNLYKGAQVVLVLSKYEGFGWPILEAQASGVPVLCADEPVLREVGGAGCVYVRVESLEALNTLTWQDLTRQLQEGSAAAAGAENLRRFNRAANLQQLERVGLSVAASAAEEAVF